MTDTPHILVVDDEPDICEGLKAYLSDQGFRVSTAESGLAMRETMERSAVDLVILDLMMPGEDGLSITQRIRKSNNVGIIILTGKGDPVDQIVGLEIGADDYISKPCDLRQLLARVRSVLRRANSVYGIESGSYTQTLEFAGWTLDLGKRQLRAPDGEGVPLTTGEFQLLEALATNPSRVLSRDHLLEITKSRNWSPFDRTIDNLVSRLRRKIEEDTKHPQFIKTVHGAGYVFTPKVERR